MTSLRLLFLAASAALALLGRPAAAQVTSPPAKVAAAPAAPSKYHYTLFWGLWTNYPKAAPGAPRAHYDVAAMGPVTLRHSRHTDAKQDSTYQHRSMLGGAVQWTEKRPTPTR